MTGSRSRPRDSIIWPGPATTLLAAGAAEIVLFGLPLVLLGPMIGYYVYHFDAHIYKEYGVARMVMGVAFLMGARRPPARHTIAQVGTLFYSANIVVSVTDIILGNVSRGAEAAVVVVSFVLALALGRVWVLDRRPAPT